MCTGAAVLYARGLARSRAGARPGPGRALSFFAGWTLVYFVMQTRFDYLSQHMFFIHRIQHLVLHHLGPFLVALSAPGAVLARGLPAGVRERLLGAWNHPARRFAYRLLQNAAVAPLLFVGLIYLWLMPSIHFDAMLSAPLYALMNWSMLLDGLLFWSLMLDRRPRRDGALLGFGLRIWIVLLAIVPQIAIGAYIALSGRDLYEVYAVCGRAWALGAGADQTLGGCITWIPAGMMHVAAALILIGRWMHADPGPAARPACAS